MLPPFYYGFYCSEMQFWFWVWLSFCYVFCSLALVAILSPNLLGKIGNKWMVAGICIVAGYSCSPGFLHLWFYIDRKYLPVVPVWTWIIAGLFAAFGGVIYALHIPERWYPKRFDIIGNSHNLFHCMGFVAAILAFKASLRMYHER